MNICARPVTLSQRTILVIGAEVRRMGEVDAVGGDAEGAPPDAQRAAQQQAQGDGTQPEE